MISNSDRIKLAIGLILSAMPCVQAGNTRSHISSLYRDFELPVSAFISFLISIYPIFYALPILVLAAWFVPKWQNRRGITALNVGISIFLLGFLYGLILWWPFMSADPAFV